MRKNLYKKFDFGNPMMPVWPLDRTVIDNGRKNGQKTLRRANREKALEVRYGMREQYPGGRPKGVQTKQD
jgi:hypothetical protein